MYNAHKNGLQNHTFVFSIEFNLVLNSNYSIFEEKKKKSIRLQILQSLRVDICSACGLFKEILQLSVLENETKLSSLFKMVAFINSYNICKSIV